MRPPKFAFLLVLCACTAADAPSGPAKDRVDPDATPEDSGALDTSAPQGWQDDEDLYTNCWSDIDPLRAGFPVYENFGLRPGRHCAGSDHQEIEGVERVVFLGDSITAGTPPNDHDEVYRSVLGELLQERFGADIEISDCSEFGARTDDYLPRQIPECFPTVEEKRTLIISTMGGNDLFAAAQSYIERGDFDDALTVLDRTIGYQRDTMRWVRDNEDIQFPNGVYVVAANVYEFTDTSGNLSSCPTADVLGFGGQASEVSFAVGYLNASYAEIAVETNTDLVFMGESFCGHGFLKDDASLACYRGPDQEIWFDNTCIHPNPAGHEALAGLFDSVIAE
jgi:hypothetical protein